MWISVCGSVESVFQLKVSVQIVINHDKTGHSERKSDLKRWIVWQQLSCCVRNLGVGIDFRHGHNIDGGKPSHSPDRRFRRSRSRPGSWPSLVLWPQCRIRWSSRWSRTIFSLLNPGNSQSFQSLVLYRTDCSVAGSRAEVLGLMKEEEEEEEGGMEMCAEERGVCGVKIK